MINRNFIVLHNINNKTVSRFDFGEELDKAINFIHDLMEEAYQKGEHQYLVIDEITQTRYYKQEFEIL